MTRARVAAAALWAATALGCTTTHERLWGRLDELELPADYVLYEEKAEGTRLGLFGDRLRVTRRYRSPRSFEATCAEVRAAGERFATGSAVFHQHEGELFPVCSITFSRRGGAGDINVSGPFGPGVAEQLGIPDRTDVLVDARMMGD